MIEVLCITFKVSMGPVNIAHAFVPKQRKIFKLADHGKYHALSENQDNHAGS